MLLLKSNKRLRNSSTAQEYSVQYGLPLENLENLLTQDFLQRLVDASEPFSFEHHAVPILQQLPTSEMHLAMLSWVSMPAMGFSDEVLTRVCGPPAVILGYPESRSVITSFCKQHPLVPVFEIAFGEDNKLVATDISAIIHGYLPSDKSKLQTSTEEQFGSLLTALNVGFFKLTSPCAGLTPLNDQNTMANLRNQENDLNKWNKFFVQVTAAVCRMAASKCIIFNETSRRAIQPSGARFLNELTHTVANVGWNIFLAGYNTFFHGTFSSVQDRE
jgi:hypothetical protein